MCKQTPNGIHCCNIEHDVPPFRWRYVPIEGQGPLIIEASRLHSGELPWTSDCAHCRDLYLTSQKTHKQQTPMLLAGFEPVITASQ